MELRSGLKIIFKKKPKGKAQSEISKLFEIDQEYEIGKVGSDKVYIQVRGYSGWHPLSSFILKDN